MLPAESTARTTNTCAPRLKPHVSRTHAAPSVLVRSPSASSPSSVAETGVTVASESPSYSSASAAYDAAIAGL